eukprot:gene41691-65822_t
MLQLIRSIDKFEIDVRETGKQNVMNASIKTLSIGIIGGLIPFGAYLFVNSVNSRLSDEVIDGNRKNFAKMVNMPSFDPELTNNFVAASEASINSVVHVTTKTVKTH